MAGDVAERSFEAEAEAGAHDAASEDRAAPLTARAKALYSFGDLADGMANASLFTYLFFYLTAACGLSGSLAGAVLFVSLALDAIADPFIGYLSDNTRSKWGRRHPYIIGIAVPYALIFGLMFSLPDLGAGWLMFGYALGVLILLRLALSAFILPFGAIGAELTTNYAERSVIMTYRNFFNICSQVFCIYLGFGLFLSGEGLTSRAAYVGFGWTGAAVILAGALVAGFGTLGLRGRLYTAPPTGRLSLKTLASEMADVFRNRSFRLLFLTVLVLWSALGVGFALDIHASRYFWRLSTDAIQTIQFARIAGLLAGVFVSGLLVRVLEKRDITILGVGVLAFCAAVPPLLAVAGLMPGPGTALYVILGAFNFALGVATTCVGVSFGSMMADAADEHDHLYGVRREALYLSGITFSWKAALGVGGLVAGLALDAIAFPSDIAQNPNQTISQGTLDALALVSGPGVAIFVGLSILILVRYHLGARELERIQAALAARRKAGT